MNGIRLSLSAGLLVVFLSSAASAVKVGEPAPEFTVKDSKGNDHRLSDGSGKFIVLEWHNQGCPFVQKHYETGNMQKLQKEWTAKGVVWFSRSFHRRPGSRAT
jgi:peroxiredoxin